jgi:zinc protease
VEELLKTGKEQSLVMMGFKGATLRDEDRYALQVISTALSGISGRLSQRLREKAGIAYALGAFSVPALDPGYFAIYVLTTKENIERSKRESVDQLRSLCKSGLTKEELEATKNELAGNQLIALQTNAALSHQAALDELYGLGHDHYAEYGGIIDSIENEDIVEVARRYLNPEAYTLVVIEGE